MTEDGTLYVARPPGTSPGWTVWHRPSGLQAIQPVRYKKDAERAREELLTVDACWEDRSPVPYGSAARTEYEAVYRKYGLLRQRQLADNAYWPRPKETHD